MANTYNSATSWTSAPGYPTYPAMVAPVPVTNASEDDTVSEEPVAPTKMTDFLKLNAATGSMPVGFELPATYTGANDGVLGLGPSNTAGGTNYVDVLYLNKLISQPVMSISFVIGTGGGTTMVFGEQPAKTLYTGTLTAFAS